MPQPVRLTCFSTAVCLLVALTPPNVAGAGPRGGDLGWKLGSQVSGAFADPNAKAQPRSDEREASQTLKRTIEGLLEQWRQAVLDGSSRGLEKVLDVRGVHAQSLELEPLDCLAEPLQVMQFTRSLLDELTGGGRASWDELEVLGATINDRSGRILATTRVSRGAGDEREQRFLRWLFEPHEDSWRVVDRIELDSGLALSWSAAGAFASSPDAPAWTSHIDELLRGVKAMRAGDGEQMIWALDALEGVGFPEPMTGTLDLIRAAEALKSGRLDAALRWQEEARTKLSDLPQLDRLGAFIHGARGEWEAVLEDVERYTQKLPGDAELFFFSGQAAAALGLTEEAREAYRAGLAVKPQSVDNLLGLARSLQPEEMLELRESFRRLEDPSAWFEPLVVELLGTGDLDAVEALLAELRRVAPDDPNGDYFEATMLMERGQVRDAANLLKSAFPKVADPDELRFYVQQYVDACVQLGVPKEAYRNSPDRPFVFDLLCNYFLEVGQMAELELLVREHELEFPDDPWLPYYRAELLRSAGDLEAAALRFEEGMLNAKDDEAREIYRWNLVRVRIEAGQGMQIYDEVEPQEVTYQQLLAHALKNKDSILLDALIEVRLRDRMGDPQLPLLEGVRAFWNERYAEAVVLIQGARSSLAADDEKAAPIERALILSALRTGALEVAEREAQLSTRRDGDPFFEAIVYGAQGEHQRALEALMTCIERFGYNPETFYRDPDLAPMLLTHEAYTFFRRRFPPPAESEGS